MSVMQAVLFFYVLRSQFPIYYLLKDIYSIGCISPFYRGDKGDDVVNLRNFVFYTLFKRVFILALIRSNTSQRSIGTN